MAFSGDRAAVFIAGTPVAFTNEVLTSTDNLSYTVQAGSVKTTWDSSATTMVQTSPDGTTWGAATGYSIDYLNAKVTFSTAQPAGTQVRASGQYIPTTQVADATAWDITIDTNLKKTTRFRADWATQVPLVKSSTAKFDRWWVDGYFTDTVMASLLLVVFYTTDTMGYKAFAWVNNDAVKSQVDDIVTESISLTIQGAIASF